MKTPRELPTPETATDDADTRRPYVAPALRHLGDVRSVTLANGITVVENPVLQTKKMM